MSEIKNNLQFKDDKLHLEDEVVMKKVSGIPVNQEDETGTIDVDANINIGGSASINGDVTVKGSVTIDGTSYKVIENPEYVWAIIDSDDKILCGIKTDGKFVADIDGIDEKIQEAINQMQTIIDEAQASIDEKIAAIDEKFDFISWIEDPEGRSEITTDSEGKILSYRDADGVKHENVGIETDTLNVENIAVNTIEIKNISKLKEDLGVQNEKLSPKLPQYGNINIKQETFYLEAYEGVSSINDVEPIRLYPDTAENGVKRISRSKYFIKGTNTSLMFFASGKVKLNTEDNKYYAETCVRKINGKCYYHDTLVCSSDFHIKDTILEGYTVEAPNDETLSEGEAKMVNIEVVQIVGTPCIEAWTVEDFDSFTIEGTDIGKKYGHQCIVDVDFGDYYYKKNAPIEVKYQGNSTNSLIKRGLRFTFYKKNDFKKKDKIKIGEMIRLSGYNLKAEAIYPLVKEYMLYTLINDTWNNRPITDRYDWDNIINGYYHGATGTIKSFPVRLDIANNFYGVYFFGLKKDEKNYMLDGTDEGGLFVGASGNDNNAWGKTLPYDISFYYEDEMLDELSESTTKALENWIHFIQGRLYKGSDGNDYNITELTNIDGVMYVTSTLIDGAVTEDSISAQLIEFNRKNIPERLDVLGFIDYLIFIQVFTMSDSYHNNVMMYSNSEKKKIWPFFYDVDHSWSLDSAPLDFIKYLKENENADVSIWENIASVYWDEILNRYYYLRDTVLNNEHISTIHEFIRNSIPDTDYIEETNKWGKTRNKNEFNDYISAISDRLKELDSKYFKN